MKPSLRTSLIAVAGLLAAAGAHADYYDYRYIGNPTTFVATTNPDSRFAGGHVTVDFHSTTLLAADQSYWLLATPGISHVVVNFDYTGGLHPDVASTFAGNPTAMFDPYYSYITVGSTSDQVSAWEIVEYFQPYGDLVETAAYGPEPTFKPFCTHDCTGIDQISQGVDHVWNYDVAGHWTVTLVPEPGSSTMMLWAGIAALGWAGLRRRRH
jgi:MYXO-CTERM domain-containing protein